MCHDLIGGSFLIDIMIPPFLQWSMDVSLHRYSTQQIEIMLECIGIFPSTFQMLQSTNTFSATHVSHNSTHNFSLEI